MVKHRRIIASVMALAMAASLVSVPEGNVKAEETKQEYVVMAKNEKGYDQVEKKYGDEETENVEQLEDNNILVLELTDTEADKIEKRKDIVYVEENIVLDASLFKNVSLNSKKNKTAKSSKRKAVLKKKEKQSAEDCRSEQWNLDAIHLAGNDSGSDKIRIGIIDSGISYDEDLDVQQRVTINEKNEVDNVMFDDATGHGTAIAGIIGSKNNKDGIRGICPDAEIYSIQVLDENNQTTLSQVIAGIYTAIDSDCDIINMSFGTTVDSELLHQAVSDAHRAGILMIAAAGNRQGGKVEYPAAYEEVMAVGSTDTTGNKAEDTSDGAEIEIFAPGDQILTNGLFGGMTVVNGTSIAVAHVSGAAALLWSKNKGKSAGFIRSLLANTAQQMSDHGVSDAGLLDIEMAFDKYDELERVYVENEYDYHMVQEDNNEAESYDGIKLVNGLWHYDTHAAMCSYVAEDYKISNNNIRLMQEAARRADRKYSDTMCLHACSNYVKSTKFLYQCALYLRKGDSNTTAISKAVKDSKLDLDDKHDKKLKSTVEKFLTTPILSGVSEDNSTAKYYKVMGLAMHVVGDTYAHRTIVPTYTISNAGSTKKNSKSVTSADARFGTNDFNKTSSHKTESNNKLEDWAKEPGRYNICKQWSCFKKAVNMGIIEFRDIKYFAVKGDTERYEDDLNFCKERYADAKLACEVLMEQANYKEKFDGFIIFMPTEKYVKLNGFKYFTKKAGEDTSYLNAKEWEEISTSKVY